MQPRLEPPDIFFTRGHSLLSRAIRFFTRGIGESRTLVNHVGLVVEGGTVHEAVVVEALSRVVRHRLWDRYAGRRDDVAVFRPTNLTASEVATIVAAAEAYHNKKYGALKILAHLADWLLLGAFVFRRLAVKDNYPICSWVVAHAYKKAGKDFRVHERAASPDDIWDFVTKNTDKYVQVRDLRPL
jgi:hypothetical protein